MIYVVQAGDTLYAISQKTGVSVEKIRFDNQIEENGQLAVGQALLILSYGESGSIRGDMQVTGYAYPFIRPEILEEALPSLDELLVFSYGFTQEGELIPPQLDDLWMIEAAWGYGVRPILVLTPIAEDTFNNQLVKTLVENAAVQETLIYNLLDTIRARGFAGVDVDFEYILPENRVLYAQFVGNLRAVMQANGYQTSVALAPKESAAQSGLLYEGVDYRLLGENADYVFLMTYEWGYTYGPPMAVAPLNKVRQVVEYAMTEIPREKIVMGIPNYAYNWTLPFVRGETRAELIGNVEAPALAASVNAEIKYAEPQYSPYFNYTQYGSAHEVWFEDVRSITAKLELAKGYGLRGVGYWNLMRPFYANWLLVRK